MPSVRAKRKATRILRWRQAPDVIRILRRPSSLKRSCNSMISFRRAPSWLCPVIDFLALLAGLRDFAFHQVESLFKNFFKLLLPRWRSLLHRALRDYHSMRPVLLHTVDHLFQHFRLNGRLLQEFRLNIGSPISDVIRRIMTPVSRSLKTRIHRGSGLDIGRGKGARLLRDLRIRDEAKMRQCPKPERAELHLFGVPTKYLLERGRSAAAAGATDCCSSWSYGPQKQNFAGLLVARRIG